MLIFSRVHFKDHLMTGVPIASIKVPNATEWSRESERALQGRCSSLELENHESHISTPSLQCDKTEWDCHVYIASPYDT
jgi:hypothetical protein